MELSFILCKDIATAADSDDIELVAFRSIAYDVILSIFPSRLP